MKVNSMMGTVPFTWPKHKQLIVGKNKKWTKECHLFAFGANNFYISTNVHKNSYFCTLKTRNKL